MRTLNPRSGWELKQGGGAGVAVGLNSIALSAEMYGDSSSYGKCAGLPDQQAHSPLSEPGLG